MRQGPQCTHKYRNTLREHMVTNLRDRSVWSFGLARELPGPVPEFPVAS